MSIASLLKTFQEEVEVGVTPDLKFVEKGKGGFSLKGFLSRQKGKLLRKAPPMRQGVSFSPSTLTYNYCRRLKVAQLAGKTEIFYDKSPPSKQINFDLGNIIHDLLRDYFWQIGVLKGDWYCIKCDKIYYGLVAPATCPSEIKSHGRKALSYREMKIKNAQYNLAGRPDGVLVIDDREDELLDIKSIAARTVKTSEMQFTFDDLETQGPRDKDVIQINLYMFMMGIMSSHLLYINKNDGKIKTFTIPFDYDLIKPYLNEIEHLLYLAEKWKKNEIKMEELPTPCGRKDCSCETFLTNS